MNTVRSGQVVVPLRAACKGAANMRSRRQTTHGAIELYQGLASDL
jgi:hypothetical protein